MKNHKYKYAFILSFYVQFEGFDNHTIFEAYQICDNEELYLSQINDVRNKVAHKFEEKGLKPLGVTLLSCTRTLND